MPENGLTELDRLIFVVHNIEKCCQIVPCGSYMKSPSQEIQKNDAFSGCSIQQLTDANCYMHLRACEQLDKKELAEREEDIFNHEFLDSAKCDLPNGCWSIQKDPINPLTVTIRSNLWPGFYAYHRANSAIFGGVYMGDGIRNLDLPFMS